MQTNGKGWFTLHRFSFLHLLKFQVRVLECKRRYAKRKRQRNKSEKKDNDDNMSRSERANSVETMASTTTTNTTNTTTTTNTTATSNSQYHNESFNKLLASLNNNNDFNDNSLVENFINLPQFINSRSPSPSTSNSMLQYSQQPSIMDHFNSSPYVIQEQKDAALQLLSLGSPDTLHSYNHDINDNYNDNIQ